jgi:hypothetical protein
MRGFFRRLKALVHPPVDIALVRAAMTGNCLVVVSRTRPDVFDYLRTSFAGDDRVEVLVDRRSGWGRRRKKRLREPERRQGDRRRPPSVETDLTLNGYLIVPRGPTR